MASQNNTTPAASPLYDEELNISLGILTVLIVNATFAFTLILGILLKIRRRRFMYYLNILMLLFTLALSFIRIPFQWNLLIYQTNHFNPSSSILIGQTAIICVIKIITEVILILRLRLLYPTNNVLLIVCIILVVIHLLCEIYSMANFIMYGYQNAYKWIFIAEPFLQAINNIFFSSAFILTLVAQMRSVRRSIGGLRHHRLFFFLVLVIENMIVPCISSFTFAIYSFYVVDQASILLAYMVSLINICITVTSIVMTTLLGANTTSQLDFVPSLRDRSDSTPKDETPLRTLPSQGTLPIVTAAKNSPRMEDEELGYHAM